MIRSEVIIVGGGPAGSTCGWILKKNGMKCLILDKQKFPRPKLCAGWITPEVISNLRIDINKYPGNITKFNKFHVHLRSKELEVKVNQYAIKREEFDHWLLKRSGVELHNHKVIEIKNEGDNYIIDEKYSCKYLIGAGGTYCPVYQTYFKQGNPRIQEFRVVTLEEEFIYNYQDSNCHLWLLQNRLPGYSWYVPKSDGYLNLGIGGFFEKLKAKNKNIKFHWNLFTQKLEQLSLVKNYLFNPKGYTYYVRNHTDIIHLHNTFIIGDAAGLATKDMGEGIGPGIKSGILAANAILYNKPFIANSIRKFSFKRHQTLLKLLYAYVFN